MSDTDMLYMASLQKRLADTEAENADPKQRISELEDKHWDECRQIAHYDDELKEAKRLLKLAVESMTESCSKDCHSCANKHHRCCEDDVCYKWEHADEALALIGEDINVNTREDGERNDNCLLR